MPDNALTVDKPAAPTHQAVAVKTRSQAGRVTGKLADAINLMIEEGTRWDQAAVKVGLTVRNMRLALERPHVLAHLRARKQVSREAASAANIKRLCEIRDAANNMPAVQAIKALEQLPDDNVSASKGLMPGFVVQIVNVTQPAGMPHTHTIEAKPLKSQDDIA